MKPFLTPLILVSFLCSSALAATPTSSQGKRIQDLNVISTKVLQRSISPKFYKSLLVSPIEGWIVVRGSWVGSRISGPRIVRSELGGVYDQLALKFANDFEITGSTGELTNLRDGAIMLHLLVYHTADGTMLLSFPTFDIPGGDQMYYWGCARLAVIKKADGRWVEIEGPDGLHGRGWAVRPSNAGGMPYHADQNGPSLARDGKFKAKLPPPPASVLGPIIAGSKGEVIVGPSVRER
ncbi:MAG TPA: hypothetical protein VJU77_09905 [Chthoniobacterales bacterium]|nr:hypothetical protein [Chthoniobacterales bacterium]